MKTQYEVHADQPKRTSRGWTTATVNKGIFLTRELADARADELRRQGARNVRVNECRMADWVWEQQR